MEPGASSGKAKSVTSSLYVKGDTFVRDMKWGVRSPRGTPAITQVSGPEWGMALEQNRTDLASSGHGHRPHSRRRTVQGDRSRITL